MGIITAIGNGLLAVARYFGWATQRDAEKNAPDIKAAAIAAEDQNEIDRINKDVAEGKTDEIRKDIAQ